MRLIDADTLRANFTGNFLELWHYTAIWAMIDLAPTVEAVPVVRGEWLIIHEGIERNLNTWEHVVKRKYFCNRCDYQTGNQGKYFNFCPN